MALMQFREKNQVNYVGVRPAHDGTQIVKVAWLGGAGNANIYTVPAGVTLFITYMMLSSRLDVAAAATAKIETIPVGEAGLRMIIEHLYDLAGHQITSVAFSFPIEVAATEPITLVNVGAGMDSRGLIHGWIQ